MNKKWALGLFFIFVVTLIWSVASFLTQYIYADLEFKSPFILTYISSSFFAVYLPLWHFLAYFGLVTNPPWRSRHRDERGEYIKGDSNTGHLDHIDETTGCLSHDSDDNLLTTVRGSVMSRFIQYLKKPILADYSHEDIFYLGLLLTPLWFFGNILYNYSLLMTSISSSTVISNTSGVFTMFFSWLCGIEDLSMGKFLGLFLCLCGVTLVTIQDNANSSESSSSMHSITGDVVAVIGAMLYGLYTTILKLKLQEDDVVSMQLVLGYLGLVNAVVCSPVLIVMIVQGWGDTSNFTWTIFGFIVLSAVFDDVIADYLWARAVLLTSPTVATVGLSMTIPLAILTDVLSGLFYGSGLNGSALSSFSLFGALLVVVGFFFVNMGLDPVLSLWRRLCGSGSGGSDRMLPADLLSAKTSLGPVKSDI